MHPSSTTQHDPALAPFLDIKASDNNAAQAPPGWPTSPRRIESSLFTTVLGIVFDLALFGSSCAFFVFALIVYHYDQTPTAENPVARRTLEDTAKYVTLLFLSRNFPLTFSGPHGFFQFFLLRSLDEQRTRSCFGVWKEESASGHLTRWP